MASVTSYTAEHLMELMAGWQSVADAQEELGITFGDFKSRIEAAEFNLIQFKEEILPGLQDALAANDVRVADLNETKLPDLETRIDNNATALSDLNDVVLPALQQDLDNAAEAVAEVRMFPRVFSQPDEPEGDDERDLQVGDVWLDTDDNFKRYKYDGNSWLADDIQVQDLSLTVRKFNLPTHLIY